MNAKIYILGILACFLNNTVHAQTNPTIFDIHPVGNTSSGPAFLTVFKNKLYFYAEDTARGYELWCIDSAMGAHRITDINPGKPSMLPHQSGFVSFAHYYELPIAPYLDTANPSLYFLANDGSKGVELYYYNGTGTAGLAKEIIPGSAGIYTLNTDPYTVSLANLKNNVYISDNSGNIWEYNTTTQLSRSLPKPSGMTLMEGLTTFNGKLYFISNGVLWRYDPVTDAMSQPPNVASAGTPFDLQVIGNKLYFQGTAGAYEYDGNNITKQLQFGSGCNSCAGFNTHKFLGSYKQKIVYIDCINNQPAFCTYDPANGNVSSFSNINGLIRGADYVEYNGRLYFSGCNGTLTNLWEYDGLTPPVKLFDFSYVLNTTTSAMYLHTLSDGIYFLGFDKTLGREVFKYTPSATSVHNTSFNGDVKLYPNPASNITTLSLNLTKPETFSIIITDMAGKEVYSLKNTEYAAGKSSIKIDIQTIPSGNYFCSLKNQMGALLYGIKIVKE